MEANKTITTEDTEHTENSKGIFGSCSGTLGYLRAKSLQSHRHESRVGTTCLCPRQSLQENPTRTGKHPTSGV